VHDQRALVRFYDNAYASDPLAAERFSRWRALGAVAKADHVIRLCAAARLLPTRTLEVGCGDGALLSELHRRGFGGVLHGVEIAPAAVELARSRPQIEQVELYDGQHLLASDLSYDLGIVSHVLEHVHEPDKLLAEISRACRAVLVEVPLEANLSARRASKREHSQEVGHLQRLDRAAVRAIVAAAGLRVVDELQDGLPLAVHRFFAASAAERVGAQARWATRATLSRVAPSVARRLFTVHYACLCTPS
jgi:SAM-dependent methyltransferase